MLEFCVGLLQPPCFIFPVVVCYRSEFGSVRLDVEQKKKEDRTLELTQMNVSEFLSVYKEKDLYVVQSVPEEMKRESGDRPVLHGVYQRE